MNAIADAVRKAGRGADFRLLPKMTWTRLYDPNRTSSHWTEIVREGEYCVFILNADNRTPRDLEGRTFLSGRIRRNLR
jgi:hypothetical protein